jgi:Na+-transporting NADH:ubiquinone oxidoreductase subunit C
MAINKNSNGFTFGFAVVMVIVVGALLATAALALKAPQQENVKQEKMQNILGAIQVETPRAEAPGLFQQYVKERIVISYDGEVVSNNSGEISVTDKQDGFNIDVKKQFKSIKTIEDRVYPYYVCEKDGETFYVIPMVGKGLWGPIWGFVALESDYNTIYGATFDHKTETPGLGAEIKEDFFEKQFTGKKIFNNGEYVSVDVMKGGAPAGNDHGVDAITGGTITSVGVADMLQNTLGVYAKYFKTKS